MPDLSAEQQALAVVDRYLETLNARDTEGIRDTFNFPHFRISMTGDLARFEQREDYDFSHFFNVAGRDGWAYTRWDKTEAVFSTAGKVHVAVNFTRYRRDDSVIGKYFSLYVITRQNGHWGIQFGSGGGS